MLTPLLLPLLLVVGAPAASTVALRSDARPVTQAQAATMPPPALADALLAAGHPPIVATSLPERSGEVYASDPHGGRMWSIHLALDGDRIVALRMVHQFPAPF